MKNNFLSNQSGQNERIILSVKPDFKCFVLKNIFSPFLLGIVLWLIIIFVMLMPEISDFKVLGMYAREELYQNIFFALIPVFAYILTVIISICSYYRFEYAITKNGVYYYKSYLSRKAKFKTFSELRYSKTERGYFSKIFATSDIWLSSDCDELLLFLSPNRYFKGIIMSDIPDYYGVYKIVQKLQSKYHEENSL